MENYGLDLHGEMLLEEYRQQLPLYKRLMEVMKSKTAEIINEGELTVASMEFRIKEEASLAGKLQRKGSKYGTLRDITDIFGGRIIMYYNEDVDRVASFVESKLEIDWPNSVDKRKMHEVDSFGYNPKEYHRMLSRLAGMMELADDEFSRIRNSIADYRRRMQNLVLNGQLEEVALDGDTFLSYVAMHPFDKLNRKIAAITQAEIQESTFIPYLTVLRQLDIKTLGDVERLVANYFDDAYQLALFQLGSTDIDILASTVGLQNLCFVHILKTGRGIPGLVQMFDAINGRMPQNEDLARMVFEQAARLSFMNK